MGNDKACGGLYYEFSYNGFNYSIHEDELAFCYPSLADDGSYFFTLNCGASFRGERVKEVMRKVTSPLGRYLQCS